MKRWIRIALLVSGIVAGFGFYHPKVKNPVQSEIIGQWRNLSVQIRVNSFNNKDSSFIVEANESNWEQKLHIKPIRTFFKADGSYYSEYHDLNDSIIYSPSGKYLLKDDSIIITQLKPGISILRFQLTIKDSIAFFHGMIDFDQDGKDDDEYTGRQKKFN